ncbi:hypothetical protein E3T61_18465 [Cryobacterium lactosi]|uniref:Uncharacterized protein n=1 Tax=Cryobacterium lactosi TaxID=1259202 RepID=A0A4R9BI98_9MICO|nr:hypothetical protein [Cryobacterium lactosi]TFD85004.1 hypothetical protein E3T61_18465 [Cryobacterium lactosi]
MTTTPESATPEAAEADLAQLEQQVIDGGDVTVADLTAAKERVSFARLVLKGVQDRAEAKRLKNADDLRAKTKVDVAKMFTGGQYVDPLVAYDEAVVALDRLAIVIKGNTALLDDAYHEMSRGGVAVVGWDGGIPAEHDPANSARVAQGDQVTSLTSDGITYIPQEPSLWVRAAAHKVAEMHGGLTIPYGPSLESVLRGDKPSAISARVS